MPQLLLPGFPAGATPINETISVYVEDGHRVWLLGQIEIFRHPQDDHASFKTIVSALLKGGLVRPSEFERSDLKLTHRTLMNWQKQYQRHGASAFYGIRRPRPAGRVMTVPKVSACQRMLEARQSVAEVAKEAGINESTLRKAMARDVLSKAAPAGDLSSPEPASTKTERAGEDAQAGMGMACTRPQERVAASLLRLVQVATQQPQQRGLGLSAAAWKWSNSADVKVRVFFLGFSSAWRAKLHLVGTGCSSARRGRAATQGVGPGRQSLRLRNQTPDRSGEKNGRRQETG